MKKYFPVIALAAAAYGVVIWLRRKATAGQNLRYEIEDIAIIDGAEYATEYELQN